MHKNLVDVLRQLPPLALRRGDDCCCCNADFLRRFGVAGADSGAVPPAFSATPPGELSTSSSILPWASNAGVDGGAELVTKPALGDARLLAGR